MSQIQLFKGNRIKKVVVNEHRGRPQKEMAYSKGSNKSFRFYPPTDEAIQSVLDQYTHESQNSVVEHCTQVGCKYWEFLDALEQHADRIIPILEMMITKKI